MVLKLASWCYMARLADIDIIKLVRRLIRKNSTIYHTWCGDWTNSEAISVDHSFSSSRPPSVRRGIEEVVEIDRGHAIILAAFATAVNTHVNATRASGDTITRRLPGRQGRRNPPGARRHACNHRQWMHRDRPPLEKIRSLREELDTHEQTQRQARDACVTVAEGTDFGLPCFPRGNVNHEVVASSSTVASRHLRRLRPVRKRPPRRSPRRRGGLEAVRFADLVVDGDKVECV